MWELRPRSDVRPHSNVGSHSDVESHSDARGVGACECSISEAIMTLSSPSTLNLGK